jgi:malate synthase
MLVSGLDYEVSKEEDCERNLSDAIQYLTSYLAGNGYVPITKTFPDGVPVTLMEDAATLVCIPQTFHQGAHSTRAQASSTVS